MRIFLTGIGCVGKTTIGKKMGELLGLRFFDLDYEIEAILVNRNKIKFYSWIYRNCLMKFLT